MMTFIGCYQKNKEIGLSAFIENAKICQEVKNIIFTVDVLYKVYII